MSSRVGGGTPVRAAVLLSVGLLVAAVLQGVLWARVAPGTPYQVRTDGFGALPTTTNYRFAAAAIFALGGILVGATAAVAAWSVRRARGIPMLLTIALGSLAGAWLAWGIGAWLAPGTDPAALIGADPTIIVVGHATTGTWLVTLAQPTAAAAVYTVLAAWNGVPDLGTASRVSGDGTPRRDPSPGTHAP